MTQPEQAPRIELDDLCGVVLDPAPGETLTIGRNGDLRVGEDNPYMHRRALQLYSAGGAWYLQNIGSHVTVMLRRPGDARGMRLAPAQIQALTEPAYSVLFGVKRENYEIEIRQEVAGTGEPLGDVDTGTATLTIDELTERERALVAAFAEDYLRGRVDSLATLCTDARAAEKLGTTAKAVEHRRTELYELILGGGLVSDMEWRHTHRRQRMTRAARALIDARLVTVDDLALLD
ncbi:hypothetical protein CSPHI_10570 [Corynebacterium sphenisci DSM 44792]|uniref:FHA domain-containing protein n=1 Tax=Corynebacterium sphenisci DSM 44792 TaxID=1437874 RepID=A0A1L7CZZ2_9CORY|nr:hypothetical protein [Corynebacterium sphenisci]APT91363.1 hypothetical protein CSPHI_10570 [Corynebacterium sphenisci DSM 44792]